MNPEAAMRILITNNALDERGGTELYTREVALALLARGHHPMVFTLEPGKIATELVAAGVPVVDDLSRLPAPPDVIHGHHVIETTLAAMTFRSVPVLSFCHGPEAWQEAPCRLPNVAGWVVVDEACRRRLVEDEGIPAGSITLLLNFVDMARFTPRADLPSLPRKALVFSNYLSASHPVMQALTEACSARGIALESRGSGFGNSCDSPEKLLPQYDLVFAKARCALEALASGCAVVQVDHFGAGRMISLANFDEIRPLNFGFASMTAEPTATHIGSEIDRYDASDAAAVTQRLRHVASLEATVDRLVELYRQTLTFRPPDYDPAVAAADFLRFQLFLSKRPLYALKKTQGVRLRLPVPPLAGPLREIWQGTTSGHASLVEMRAARLQEKLTAQIDKSAQLKSKIADLQKQLAQLNNRPRGWRKWFGHR